MEAHRVPLELNQLLKQRETVDGNTAGEQERRFSPVLAGRGAVRLIVFLVSHPRRHLQPT